MSERINGFTVYGRLPSLNDYINACRSHWSKGATLKRQTEEDIIWQIRGARNKGLLHPVSGPVAVSFEWHESDQRREKVYPGCHAAGRDHPQRQPQNRGGPGGYSD